jgi:hypothetical protein
MSNNHVNSAFKNVPLAPPVHGSASTRVFMRKSHTGVSPAAPVHATQSRELPDGEFTRAREPVIYPNGTFNLRRHLILDAMGIPGTVYSIPLNFVYCPRNSPRTISTWLTEERTDKKEALRVKVPNLNFVNCLYFFRLTSSLTIFDIWCFDSSISRPFYFPQRAVKKVYYVFCERVDGYVGK